MASSQNDSLEIPFKINVQDSELELLHKKLELTRLPDELTEAGWEYGVPLSEIKRLLARWKQGYDWRQHEAVLNDELPQFTRTIPVEGFGDFNIHYVHKKSSLKTAIPLLFVHGSLSLPGFGFSSAPTKKGFGLNHYAEVCNKLMLALGYDQYVTQGGDWGYIITRRMAVRYGGLHVKAWHTNFPRNLETAAPPSFWSHPIISLTDMVTPLTEKEKVGLERWKWFREKGRGYGAEQSTQPQTLGYSLADSPVGLLAWIHEKLVNWTDSYPWQDDEVLTWVSIYWFSPAGPAASLRIYYELAARKPEATSIPMGYSYFPKELFCVPKRWLWQPNLVFESEHDEGGHFAAHEKPELLVGDLRKMFGKGGPVFAVVPGKTGYVTVS
ncbi:hypothetical protein EST38_g4233 [Candolleomyces aberdarensis]|uniref:Uncharacterized protein n=1 Tax=Candolleomyces aberdarensis TaxID=2316362 RepID=A0A4Q2DRG1_9AGAR|nr:hypothetical protein EST38_g4233 [Candolleomyces aberdarensis]